MEFNFGDMDINKLSDSELDSYMFQRYGYVDPSIIEDGIENQMEALEEYYNH